MLPGSGPISLPARCQAIADNTIKRHHSLTDRQDPLRRKTLQTTRRPDLVIEQLLRIAPLGFVSFPNFAHWRVRASLMFGGHMPVTRLLPDTWYDTLNIHHVTVDDFRALVKERGWHIDGQWFLKGDRETTHANANLFAEHAVFLLRR